VYWLYATINKFGGSGFLIERHRLHKVDPTFKYDLEVHGDESALQLLREKLIDTLVLKGFKESCIRGSFIKETNTHYEVLLLGHIGRDVYGRDAPSMLVIGTSVFLNERFYDEPRPTERKNQNKKELLPLV
jgi:hypothetical protein